MRWKKGGKKEKHEGISEWEKERNQKRPFHHTHCHCIRRERYH